MNQLDDPAIIAALCEASRAGVPIDLIVRGFCCLRPGVEGFSGSVRIRSIIDRFLEHARVFHFVSLRDHRHAWVMDRDGHYTQLRPELDHDEWAAHGTHQALIDMTRLRHTRSETAPTRQASTERIVQEELRNALGAMLV